MSKYETRRSEIAGYGNFATEFIKAGELAIASKGLILPNHIIDQPPYFPYYSDNICIQVGPKHHLAPFELDPDKINGIFATNHSCDPNCGIYGDINLVAMRDIRLGEEITFDYVMTDATYPGMESIPTEDLICLCGSSKCRKVIRGDDWQIPELQLRYKSYFSSFVQEIIDQFSPPSKREHSKH